MCRKCRTVLRLVQRKWIKTASEFEVTPFALKIYTRLNFELGLSALNPRPYQELLGRLPGALLEHRHWLEGTGHALQAHLAPGGDKRGKKREYGEVEL